MSSELKSRIEELVNFLNRADKSNNSKKIFLKKHIDELNELLDVVILTLLDDPGVLIYYENNKKRREAQSALEVAWGVVDSDYLFDRVLSGETDMIARVIGDYCDRAKRLQATFLSVQPSAELTTYFSEAVSSWLFGLHSAALILCCSVIENLLKELLFEIDPGLVYEFENGNVLRGVKTLTLSRFIRNAKRQGLLSSNDSNIAYKINRLRNKAVHELREISEKDTYQSIINTKRLMEKLLD